MSQNSDNKSIESMDGCVFPVGPDGQVCGRRVATNGKPIAGRRSLYCEDPDHTRGKAFAARRRYVLAAARGHSSSKHDVAPVEPGVSERPVTDSRVCFGALLARFEESSTQLATILHRVSEVVATVSDPEAADYEIEQIQREATMQIAQAQSAQATAEHDASNARQQAVNEAEQRAQADEAAQQALREVEQIRIELADARNATTRAEAEKESAQRAAEHHRTTIQALRRQLEQQRLDHHRDLDTVRQQAHDERAELAKHYADQIAAILATLQQTSGHTQPKPATPKTQRSRPSRTKKPDPANTTQ